MTKKVGAPFGEIGRKYSGSEQFEIQRLHSEVGDLQSAHGQSDQKATVRLTINR